MQLDVTLELADKSDDIEVISDGRFSKPTFAGKLLLNTAATDNVPLVPRRVNKTKPIRVSFYLCSDAERCD